MQAVHRKWMIGLDLVNDPSQTPFRKMDIQIQVREGCWQKYGGKNIDAAREELS